MKEFISISRGSKIEIIDKTSQYLGKTGIVKDIVPRDLMINGKLEGMHILKVKFEGINEMIDIPNHPVKWDSQIKLLK